jgi:hypothetical protein
MGWQLTCYPIGPGRNASEEAADGGLSNER